MKSMELESLTVGVGLACVGAGVGGGVGGFKAKRTQEKVLRMPSS